MKPRASRWTLAMIACAGLACADRELTQPVVSSSIRPDLALTATPLEGEVVQMLKRTEDLTSDLTATAVIGPSGGHLQIPAAGVRVDFAPGAVAVPTPITITALRGNAVAYRFEPHGLVFQAPVTLRQRLRNTAAWEDEVLASQLQGSYFDRLVVDATRSYARTTEARPASLHRRHRTLEFTIEHFSGYMVTTGLVPGHIDVDVEVVIR